MGPRFFGNSHVDSPLEIEASLKKAMGYKGDINLMFDLLDAPWASPEGFMMALKRLYGPYTRFGIRIGRAIVSTILGL